MMETFIGKKRKWTKKCTDKQYLADFLYTVQLVIPDACTKFQNPKSSSSCEIFDENFPIHYIGERG